MDTTTRDTIFALAVELFARKGYHGSSMRDLAKAAGIKESTLYYHFPNKEGILQAILDYQLKGFKLATASTDKKKPWMDHIDDPVEFWMAGVNEFMTALPPLSDTVSKIIINEMYLNAQCRKFYLHTLQDARKKLTEEILSVMIEKKLIRECDVSKTAAQYVFMIQGLEIETQLKALEFIPRENLQQEIFEHIQYFIQGLQ
jgi:AcrR family transcriptional regulator